MEEILHWLMPLNAESSTKIFEFEKETRKWKKVSDYEDWFYFKGFRTPVKSLREVLRLLKENQNYSVFLVQGRFIEGTDTNKMVRRLRDDHPDGKKPTIRSKKTHLLCLDVDHFFCPGTIESQVRRFVSFLPSFFQSASYIYQASSSYGLLDARELKVHLFFWLKESVQLEVLRDWVKKYNPKTNNALDSKIYTPNQAVYTQKRICRGASDPVPSDKFIKFVKKENTMIEGYSFASKGTNKIETGNKRNPPDLKPLAKTPYDIEEGIKEVLTSKSFHDPLNRLALSLINKRVSIKDTKAILKGAMTAAKKQIPDALRLQEWETRFKDIDRTVDSAAGIVNEPVIDDLLDWIEHSSEKDRFKTIRAGFVRRGINLSPVDTSAFIHSISAKTGIGKQSLTAEIKIARQRQEQDKKEKAKKTKTALRQAQKVSELVVTVSNSNKIIKKCGELLASSHKEPPVFHYAENLVSVGMDTPRTIRQAAGSSRLGEDYPEMPIIIPYKSHHSLGARLEKDVVFLNEAGREIEAPLRVLNVLGEAYDRRFKPLTGVVEHPFIDLDWNIVQTSGYNKRTGLYSVLLHKEKIELIPPKDAWRYLSEIVFDEFPFKRELDRAVAVAALLTIAQRPVLAADEAGMPGFGIVSPTQSSGKTTMAQLLSQSIFGRPVAASGYTDDEEEMEKFIISVLKEGHGCVLLDNVEQATEVESGKLARAMSTDIFGGRQLGSNNSVKVPSCAVWLFTGNNIGFRGDMATRVYPIWIVPKIADPETRRFKRQDLGAWAIANRQKIISAALSVVLTGKELKSDFSVGSSRFKLWDKFVRLPLLSVSGIDVNDVIKENKKTDSVFLAKKQLVKEIWKVFGNASNVTTKQIIETAFGNFDAVYHGTTTSLGQALEDLLFKRAKNSFLVGKYLTSLVDVIFDDYVLSLRMTNKKFWRVTKLED